MLNGQLIFGPVSDEGAATDDAGGRIDGVDEVYEDFAGDVFGGDGEPGWFDFVGDVVQDEVAVAVGEGDLEGRLGEVEAAPGAVLVGRNRGGGLHAGELAGLGRCRDRVGGGQWSAPVDGLELALGIDAHGIGDGRRVNAEDVGGVGVVDGFLGGGGAGEGRDGGEEREGDGRVLWHECAFLLRRVLCAQNQSRRVRAIDYTLGLWLRKVYTGQCGVCQRIGRCG